MDVENIGIPACLSPRPQPRIQFLPFSYLSLLLSSMSVYNPLKGPAASKRNIIDALSLFGWLGWCTSKTEAFTFTSIFIYISSSLPQIH